MASAYLNPHRPDPQAKADLVMIGALVGDQIQRGAVEQEEALQLWTAQLRSVTALLVALIYTQTAVTAAATVAAVSNAVDKPSTAPQIYPRRIRTRAQCC